jgi:hypothetical protein
MSCPTPVHSDAEIEEIIIDLGREPRRTCRYTRYIDDGASGADHIGGGPKQCAGGLLDIHPAELPVQFPTKFEMVVNVKPPRRPALRCPHLDVAIPGKQGAVSLRQLGALQVDGRPERRGGR